MRIQRRRASFGRRRNRRNVTQVQRRVDPRSETIGDGQRRAVPASRAGEGAGCSSTRESGLAFVEFRSSGRNFFLARTENAKKNLIHRQKKFGICRRLFKASSEMQSLQTTRKAHGASVRISPWLEHQRHPVQPQLLKKGRAK